MNTLADLIQWLTATDQKTCSVKRYCSNWQILDQNGNTKMVLSEIQLQDVTFKVRAVSSLGCGSSIDAWAEGKPMLSNQPKPTDAQCCRVSLNKDKEQFVLKSQKDIPINGLKYLKLGPSGLAIGKE